MKLARSKSGTLALKVAVTPCTVNQFTFFRACNYPDVESSYYQVLNAVFMHHEREINQKRTSELTNTGPVSELN